MTVGPDVYDYATAAKFLSEESARRTGQRGRTRLLRENFNTIDMMYHDTALLSYKMDGRIIIHKCANWRTATTKRRMNQYLPWKVQVFQKDWEWYVRGYGEISHNYLLNSDVQYRDGFVKYVPKKVKA